MLASPPGHPAGLPATCRSQCLIEAVIAAPREPGGVPGAANESAGCASSLPTPIDRARVHEQLKGAYFAAVDAYTDAESQFAAYGQLWAIVTGERGG